MSRTNYSINDCTAIKQDEQPKIFAEAATKPISKMTVQELRPLARERKIPNWRTLKKKELIYNLNVSLMWVNR